MEYLETKEQSSAGELSLQSIVEACKRHIVFIVAITLLVTVLGAIVGRFFIKTKYTSSANLIVDFETTSSAYQDYSFAVVLTNTISDFMKSGVVISDACEKLEEKGISVSGSQMASSLTITTSDKSVMVKLSYSSTSEYAQEILMQLIDSSISIADSYKLDEEGNVVTENGKPVYMYSNLSNKIKVMTYPGKASNDKRSKTIKYTLIFFVIGLVLSVGAVVLRMLFNDTYRSKEEVEEELGIDVLALLEDITEDKEK